MAAKASPVKGKAGGKKLPKWAYVVGAVGVVGAVYYVKKNKESTTGQATPTADEGLTNQSFIPVTGENVAGAGGGGVGGEGGSSALLGLVSEENKQNQEYQREQSTALKEYLASSSANTAATQQSFLEQLKGLTGGGSPSSGQAGSGAGTASPPAGGTTAAPPAPPSTPTPPKTPAYHSIKCPNGCEGHYYSPSHIDCQVKKSGKCVWPS